MTSPKKGTKKPTPKRPAPKKKGAKASTENTEGKQSNLIPFKKGESGNPNGRPKGSRNKLATEFFDHLYAAWQEHGELVLNRVALSDPKDFARIVASLMPKEVEIKRPLDDMTDAELSDLITVVKSIVAEQLGAEGTPVPADEGEREAAAAQ
jgi:hypothetical protein